MFQIKICGITRTLDALAACEAGADAIGLNFYPRSSRYVAPEVARTISDAVGPRAAKIGVFVNASLDEIVSIAEQCGLDAVQLHGDERPSLVRQLAPRSVVK